MYQTPPSVLYYSQDSLLRSFVVCLELGLQIICQRSSSLYILVYVGKAFSDLTNQLHSEVRYVPNARILGREGKR